MNKINTFWELITAHRIEIPIIQRDYAQGRKDKKATQIRDGFVKSLVDALENGRQLQLDFIYGRVNGLVDKARQEMITGLLKSVIAYSNSLDIKIGYEIKSKADEDEGLTYFIPLDGQQRLTTLFLLHWYIAERSNKPKNEERRIFSRFSYLIRPSSKDFCHFLTKGGFRLDSNLDISMTIMNESSFFPKWKKDPTVRGMLVMLDKIHELLKEHAQDKIDSYWDILTKTENISFEFLNLDEFKLTDELYIKMNARGKHLSDFENFKAWLLEQIENSKDELWNQLGIDKWKKKLDIEWNDLFWYHKEKDTFEIDNEYLYYFKIMFLNFYVERLTSSNNKLKLKTDANEATDDSNKEVIANIDLLREGTYIPNSVYLNLGFIKPNYIKDIFSVLNILEGESVVKFKKIAGALFPQKPSICLDNLFGKANSTINLWDRAYLYGFIKFLLAKQKDLIDYTEQDEVHLFRWMRVTKNLVYNTAIDSPSDFVSATQSITRLVENIKRGVWDIYEFMIEEVGEIRFFSPNQVAEEKTKSQLILEDSSWEYELLAMENHEYFYGQVNFLLLFSKDNSIGRFSLEEFKRYSKIAGALFEKTLLRNASNIVQRALLSKGVYMQENAYRYNLCLNDIGTLRTREENWRRVFRNEGKSEYIKLLLDDEVLNEEVTEDALKKVCDKALANMSAEDWRYKFISPKNIDVWTYCNQRLIYSQDGLKNRITLLKESQLNHYHAEFFSYCYFLNYLEGKESEFKPFKAAKYHYVRKNMETPCAYLGKWEIDGRDFAMDISYKVDSSKYELYFFDRNEQSIPEEILSILKKNGFDSFKREVTEVEILPLIKLLCNSFENVDL